MKQGSQIKSETLLQIVALDKVVQAELVGAGGFGEGAAGRVLRSVDITEVKQLRVGHEPL